MPILLRKISETVPLPDLPVESVKAFWKDHHALVLREMEQREVTSISVAKGDGAWEVAQKIGEALLAGGTPAKAAAAFEDNEHVFVGARLWSDREGTVKALQETVFTTDPGGVSEIVDGGAHFFVVKVHASKSGKAESFEDEGVAEAAKAALERHRREEWEKNYLGNLKKRIEKEATGKPAGAKDAG